MSPDRLPTPKITFVPVIVLVGLSAAFFERIRTIARSLPALVRTAEVKAHSTVVAELRPFAVLVSPEILAFDPSAFEDLARDVGAALLPVESESATNLSLETTLRRALSEAELNRADRP